MTSDARAAGTRVPGRLRAEPRRARRVAPVLSAAALTAIIAGAAGQPAAQGVPAVFVREGFEDANLSTRGWYDSTGAPLSTVEYVAGARSLECRFQVGATGCSGGTVGRHLFPDSDAVYLSFYIKHSANWVGSGKPYHPHMFLLMTNADTAYVGPAYTHLTAYVEENGGVPLLLLQDGRNIDETRVNQDLTAITESRAVAGCNGDSDGYGNGDCYPAGTVHWNGKRWSGGTVYYDSTPGSPRYKGNWHFVEAYFKLNSIVNGKGLQDGVLRYWYDGTSVIDSSNVVLRTGASPAMKFNQFMLAPYIGDGSPLDQAFWIDDLTIAADRPVPQGAVPPPAAPGPLRFVP